MNRQANSDYPRLFRKFVEKRTRYILETVRHSEYVVNTKVQQDVLAALHYAFQLPNAWSTAKELLVASTSNMEQAGHRHTWLHYLQTGLQLSHAYKDEYAIADISFQIGYIYQLLGELDIARESFEESATYYLLINQMDKHAQALNRQAYVARLQRRHNDAKALVKQAMDILGQNHPAIQLSYFVLGNIALDSKNGKAAESYFQKSLALCLQQGDLRLVAQRLGNLGLAAHFQCDYDRAQEFYEQSISLFNDLEDSVQQAQMRMNLGNVFIDKGNPQQAIAIYDLAFPVIQKVQDRLYLAMLATNRGIACGRAKEWQKAEQSLKSAIDQWHGFANRRSESNATMELALVYRAQGKTQQAEHLLDQAMAILATIPNDPGYQSLYDTICKHKRNLSSLT